MTYALFNPSTKIYVPDTVVGTRDTSMKTNQPTNRPDLVSAFVEVLHPTHPFSTPLPSGHFFSFFFSRLGKKRAPLEQDEEEQNL